MRCFHPFVAPGGRHISVNFRVHNGRSSEFRFTHRTGNKSRASPLDILRQVREAAKGDMELTHALQLSMMEDTGLVAILERNKVAIDSMVVRDLGWGYSQK